MTFLECVFPPEAVVEPIFPGSGQTVSTPAWPVSSNQRCWPSLRGSALAFGLGGLTTCLVLGEQQLPQRLKIAPQDPQSHITPIAAFAAIAATLQTVAGLQGADRRLHPGVILSRLAKGHCPFVVLLASLFLSFRGNAGVGHDFGQFLLILRRVKAPIERSALDLVRKLLLQLLYHLRILL